MALAFAGFDMALRAAGKSFGRGIAADFAFALARAPQLVFALTADGQFGKFVADGFHAMVAHPRRGKICFWVSYMMILSCQTAMIVSSANSCFLLILEDQAAC
jgi:hypothetical protein